MTSSLTLTPAEEPLWMMAYAAAIQAELFLFGMGGRFEAWPSFYRDVEAKTPGVADAAILALRERRVAVANEPVLADERFWGELSALRRFCEGKQ